MKRTGSELSFHSIRHCTTSWLKRAGVPESVVRDTRDAYAYYGADVRLPYRVAMHWLLIAEAHLTGTVNQSRAWSPLGRGAGSRGSLNLSARFEF